MPNASWRTVVREAEVSFEATGPVAFLEDLFRTAVASAHPSGLIPGNLPEPPSGQTFVVGAGKAAAAMASAFEREWQTPVRGLVVVPHGHGTDCAMVEVREASHPVPDVAGTAAVEEMLALLSRSGERDLVVCLLSGGGTSLLSEPIGGLSGEDLAGLGRDLLASGADVEQMNTVRRKLSRALGGGLADAARPSRLVTLAISDVVGDDPTTIASGPTVADRHMGEDALAVLERFGIAVPETVRSFLESALATRRQPADTEYRILANAMTAMTAAEAMAKNAGYSTLILGELSGEASETAREHARLAKSVIEGRHDMSPPCIIVSGGETTVTLDGEVAGRGGRNTEYLLALAVELGDRPGVYALAADTDGIDGCEHNAGAWFAPGWSRKASEWGLDPRDSLAGHDSYGFFDALDQLVVTGPTSTNVNDFRAILITHPERPQT